MNTRQGIHKAHAKTLDTQQLREEFLVESIFEADSYTMTYSHIDRILFGGVMPQQEKFLSMVLVKISVWITY